LFVEALRCRQQSNADLSKRTFIFFFRNSVSTQQSAIVSLSEWLSTDPGQYARNWEQDRFDSMVADVFGYRALQVGQPEMELLRANRMPFKAFVGPTLPFGESAGKWEGVVQAWPEFLPFDSQSMDLVVLPHILETSSNPHQVLREVERVLMPEGRVVISGFNPWSLWGARQKLPIIKPWFPSEINHQVSLPRLKDWLKLLSFDIDLGHFGCYVPPFSTQKWLSRTVFFEQAGDRWWPACGAVYVVSAVKRVPGMTLLKPNWKTKSSSKAARRAAGVAIQQNSLPKTKVNDAD
jgi:SAM-dependent methyltransferase